MNLMSSALINVTMLLIILGFLLYKYSKRNFDYWEKRGVPYAKPVALIGNLGPILKLEVSIGQFLANLYKQFETRYYGIFLLNQPIFVVRDLNLVKAILVKDFNHFDDRTGVSEEKCDPFAAHMLFFLKNPLWKSLRAKMTPVFTSGKIKGMTELINVAGEDLNDYIRENVDKNSIETKELCAKYATDVIASCAFGINANSFKYENAEFRKTGRTMFAITLPNAIRQMSYFLFPNIVKTFKLRFFKKEAATFLTNVFWAMTEERQKTGRKRNDLIDILLQIQEKEANKFERKVIVAQAGQFFGAGFETSSGTMSFALYELCLHPDIQKKARSEIKSVIAEHGGFTYEALQDMKYLHLVLCETLRKYPTLPFLDRECVQDYKVPDSDLVIEKGTPVFIPMFGLHYDPKYFPEPDKFDPERFSEENKNKIPSFAYIPFGEGPRNCIGERFALLSAKAGLAHILMDYELAPNEFTPIPMDFETKTFLVLSKVGLPMKFKKVVTAAA